MKKVYLLALIACPYILNAQHREALGGGSYKPAASECISPAERERIIAELNANVAYLEEKGKLNASNAKSTAVLFDWPLKQASGFNYYSIYGISNFVDLNPATGQLLDFNCGSRTYDLSGGYNHGGIDIFLWPFSINMMQAEQAEVVAAAAGTITYKHDGEFDLNCAMGSSTANMIIIQHSDGNRSWYLHMKKFSLTSKGVGDNVVAGEYLGTVGSSGSSTGPHLHFEVQNSSNQVVDPFNGPCNSSPSLWNNQIPYSDPQINTLMTHHTDPGLANCPLPDTINARDTFLPGSSIYFAAYYHDQEVGLVSNYSILRPDNTVFNTWTHNGGPYFYSASYWYWQYTIPASQPLGEWKFRATYDGTTYEHKFYILDPVTVASAGVSKAIVYPNPASNTLHLSNVKAGRVEIADVLGKTVFTQDKFSGDQIDISALQTGMYYLKIISGSELSTQKIVVQK
jgi:murein DD-endopeptidase MepM/ murein hydrolase activator NlpD